MGRVLVLISGLAIAGWAQADLQGGCAAKEHELASKLETAEAEGRRGQARGLSKALAEVRNHCTEANLAQERRANIAESEAEVAERREDLAEARRDGDRDDIEKRERKLAEALEELEDVRAE